MRSSFCHRFAPAAGAGVLMLLAANATRADVEVGKPLPELSLKAADGQPFELRRQQDRLAVTHGGTRHTPKALVVHFFQPDCPQCHAQMQALQKTYTQSEGQGVLAVGVAHRGDDNAVRAMAQRLKITFPLVVGTDSEVVRSLAAGDTMAIADAAGVVRFAQVGYGGGDEAVWQKNIALLAAGKPVAEETVERGRLKAGDPIFAIKFDSVATGKPIALSGEGGRLTFRNEAGEVTRPKAAVGFFSRYWDFSREEMVHLQKLHERYAKDGLQVFTIAMVPDVNEAKKLTKELGVTYPVFFGHGSDLGKTYAFGWPAYVIDAVGVVRYTQVGFSAGDEKKYEEAIREVLKE